MHSELSQFVQEWNLRGVSVGKCPTATMDAVPAAVPPNRSQSDLLQRDVATYHQFPKNSGPKNSGPVPSHVSENSGTVPKLGPRVS